ncbi:hypothetical protein J6590_038812 [Homalodisca vitripennis]|nr:hypothetical protein J6590_038812 [Homalodisca vitripennis]
MPTDLKEFSLQKHWSQVLLKTNKGFARQTFDGELMKDVVVNVRSFQVPAFPTRVHVKPMLYRAITRGALEPVFRHSADVRRPTRSGASGTIDVHHCLTSWVQIGSPKA